MTKITDIKDARALKEANLPLDLPIEHRTFSEGYSRHWVRLMNAHGAFMQAIAEYSDGPRAGSLGKWRLAQRKLSALDKTAQRCIGFIAKLGGVVAPPMFKSDQDCHEYAFLVSLLRERAVPFIEFWEDAMEAVEAGTGLMIKPGDIPPWIDEQGAHLRLTES